MLNNLVSIITPCYNSSATIVETVASIQAQTYENWELIVCDDFSSDNSVEVLNELAQKDPRIRVYTMNKNQGAGVARNLAINKSKGRYVAFCDSDDIWYPEKLSIQLDLMTQCNLALTYSSYDITRDNVLLYKKNVSKKVTYLSTLFFNQLGCLTVIYDKEILGKCLMPAMRKRQDYALWLKILKEIKVTRGVEKSLAEYRLRNGSVSSNKWKLLKYNYGVYRFLNYNSVNSVLLLAAFLVAYFFDKYIVWIKKKIVFGIISQC